MNIQLSNIGMEVNGTTKLRSGLHKIIVTREMWKEGTFALKEKEFECRVLPVVKTTVENMLQFNGAWIYMISEHSVVALHDHHEVKKHLNHELKELEQVTLSVYFADRPRSFFAGAPRQVGVSIMVINMSEIATTKQTFEARFLMKTIWEPSAEEVATFQKKGYHSTGSGWRPRFIFPNCVEVERRTRFYWPLKVKQVVESKEPFVLSKYLLLENGGVDPYGSVLNMLTEYLMYGEFEFHGTFAELLELKAFPLDCQDFSIICWSNGILDEQQIVPFDLFLGNKDVSDNYDGFATLPLLSVGLSSSNVTSEWDIKNTHLSIEKKFRSNMYIIIKGRRRWLQYLWRIFMPVFLLVLGSQVAFLLPIEDGGDRVAIVFTAVLANVVYQLAVYGELPQIPYMTFLDWYNLFYFILMLLVLLANALIVFHSEDYFAENFHYVDADNLRMIDLNVGLGMVFTQLVSLIFFAYWGYKTFQREKLKLSYSYYEQRDAGIINPSSVYLKLESSERVQSTGKEIVLTRKPYDWNRTYRAVK